jgi:hypothetical protein
MKMKSREILKLNGLKSISNRAVLHRAQISLVQCYNYQNVAHVGAKYKQPSGCKI